MNNGDSSGREYFEDLLRSSFTNTELWDETTGSWFDDSDQRLCGSTLHFDQIITHQVDEHLELSKAGRFKHRTVPLNQIRKGEGADSKAKLPDPRDKYSFKTRSIAYIRLKQLGYHIVRVVEIVRICKVVDAALRKSGKTPTDRNRPCRRRKPVAFHWLDENWPLIGLPLYDRCVTSVLGIVPIQNKNLSQAQAKRERKCIEESRPN
jgi:hypothetical protein